MRATTRPEPQKIQPTALPGWRETISAPTAPPTAPTANASTKPGNCGYSSPTPGGLVSWMAAQAAVSRTVRATVVQASRLAARRLTGPAPTPGR